VRPLAADLAVLAAGTLLTMIGVEIGYHRYFTHRAFDAHPALAFVLGVLGSSAFLGPVIWWAATHRRHHAHTDREGDPHSPYWPFQGARGLWHAHAGWLFRADHTAMAISAGEVKALYANPQVVRLQRLYLVWGALGLAVPALLGLSWGGARGALLGLLWGGLGRVFIVSHLVWGINSAAHRFGRRGALPRSGRASNNVALALPTLGGGWHANHHDAPRSYTTSFAWWQVDPGGALLRALARAGLVTGLKTSGLRGERPEGDGDMEASP
jgi:stearoyl-CoA desaturase (delta-9 desaturase)